MDGFAFSLNWIDYNGVTFLVELLEWGCTFSGFMGYENSGSRDLNIVLLFPKYRFMTPLLPITRYFI